MTDALGFIAGAGGVGALIDFWIGKRGQKTVRGWLETQWLRLSDVHFGNLGQKEALWSLNRLDWIFGRSFFSVRRLVSISVIGALVWIVGVLFPIIYAVMDLNREVPGWGELALFGGGLRQDLLYLVDLLVSVVLFSISISITRFALARGLSIMTRHPRRASVLAVVFVLGQYILTCYVTSFTSSVSMEYSLAALDINPETSLLLQPILDQASKLYGSLLFTLTFTPPLEVLTTGRDYDNLRTTLHYTLFALLDPAQLCAISRAQFGWLLGFVSNWFRILLGIVFLIWFLLRPLQRPIMALWASVVESERPVFTLVFGGVAALAKGAEAVVKWMA